MSTREGWQIKADIQRISAVRSDLVLLRANMEMKKSNIEEGIEDITEIISDGGAVRTSHEALEIEDHSRWNGFVHARALDAHENSLTASTTLLELMDAYKVSLETERDNLSHHITNATQRIAGYDVRLDSLWTEYNNHRM